MTRFLFASIPIEGHSASPLSIMDRLLSTGHDVTWLSGAAYAGRAARLGVRHVPLDRWTDLSSFDDPFDAFPHLRGLRGAKLIRTGFRDVFVAEAAGQLHDIEAALEDFPADVIVADGLVFGARLAAERHGIPYAGIGDGPYAITDPEVPPFGPGLRRWPGALGRLRNRALYAVSRRFFADVNAELTRVRVEHGFPPEHPWVFDEMAAGDLYLQGSVPGFEYPIEHLPANVRFVGALRPPIPSDWVPPRWWRDLDGSWPVVHVTQGTIRPDPTELLLPTMEALADEDVLVVATTGGCDPSELGPLPPNARAESFIPYELLLAQGVGVRHQRRLHRHEPGAAPRRPRDPGRAHGGEGGDRRAHRARRRGAALRSAAVSTTAARRRALRAHRSDRPRQRRAAQRAVPVARRADRGGRVARRAGVSPRRPTRVLRTSLLLRTSPSAAPCRRSGRRRGPSRRLAC